MRKAGKGWSDAPIPDFRMGHEFRGAVVDPGGSRFARGGRVTFRANMYRGRCDMCRQGREHLSREVRAGTISASCAGAVVAVGNSVTPEIPFSLNSLALNEVRLSGSVSCGRGEFEETIGLIASGFIAPEAFATDIIGLDGLQEALRRQSAGSPGLLKRLCYGTQLREIP